MTIKITGSPKEIAALVLALQEQKPQEQKPQVINQLVMDSVYNAPGMKRNV